MTKNVIATILSLITIIGAAFAVDGMYMRRAEAKDELQRTSAQVLSLQRDLSIQQERGRIENELQVITLELEFLQAQYEDIQLNDGAKERLKERKQYLRKRQETLETRLLALEDKQ